MTLREGNTVLGNIHEVPSFPAMAVRPDGKTHHVTIGKPTIFDLYFCLSVVTEFIALIQPGLLEVIIKR